MRDHINSYNTILHMMLLSPALPCTLGVTPLTSFTHMFIASSPPPLLLLNKHITFLPIITPLLYLSLSSSGLYMMSSSLDATHKIWDLREGQLLFTLRGHEGATTCSTFTDNGAHFATGGVDKMVSA